MITPDDERLMEIAIEEARLALACGEVPVGAVCAREGVVVSRAHNERERLGDPTAHAEVLAIRRAAAVCGWRLKDVTLYVTLEPCAMCAGAIVAARLLRLVFGAYDAARGCAGSLYRVTEDPAMDWRCPAEGGALAARCEQLLKGFRFGERPGNGQ